MEEQYIKAQLTLKKELNFTKMQEDQSRAEGKTLMEKEDIEFILSLNGLKDKDYTRYSEVEVKDYESFKEASEQEYDSTRLIQAVNSAKKNGFKGVVLYSDVSNQDCIKLKKAGYFVDYTGHGSSFWCEILLSEQAFVRHGIQKFKHMFNCFKSVAPLVAS